MRNPRFYFVLCVLQVDGDWRYDSRRSALIWSIDLIDNTNRSGSLEFVVPACDPETFYPIEVRLLLGGEAKEKAVGAVVPCNTGSEQSIIETRTLMWVATGAACLSSC